MVVIIRMLLMYCCLGDVYPFYIIILSDEKDAPSVTKEAITEEDLTEDPPSAIIVMPDILLM